MATRASSYPIPGIKLSRFGEEFGLVTIRSKESAPEREVVRTAMLGEEGALRVSIAKGVHWRTQLHGPRWLVTIRGLSSWRGNSARAG